MPEIIEGSTPAVEVEPPSEDGVVAMTNEQFERLVELNRAVAASAATEVIEEARAAAPEARTQVETTTEEHRGVTVPGELLGRDRTLPTEANEAVQQGLLMLYRNTPEVAILVELMTDFDEGFREWRDRHVKMGERPIGNKTGQGGTGGSRP